VPLGGDGYFAPSIHLASSEPRSVVLWFKWYSVRRWLMADPAFPHHVIVHVSTTPSTVQLHAVRALRELYRCPVHFIGDLDPHAIAMFWLTRQRARALGFDVEYGGVDSRWVSLCRRHRKGDLADCTLTLSPFERSLFAWVENETGLDLAAMLGDEALSILRGGRKLELEGAVNPALYDATFPDALREHLFDTAASAPREGWLQVV